MAFDERHDVRVTAGLAMAKGSAAWLPSPIPRPENLGDTSRVPWRKLAKYQKPRRGCRRGLGWQRRGGCCQSSRWDSGDRGDVLSTSRLTISRASSRKVQGRRYALPDSIPRGAGEGTSGRR